MATPAPSADALAAQAGKLKGGVETKETKMQGVDPAAATAMEKVFGECGGDAGKLAAKCGCSADLLGKNPPKDAKDFAQKVLTGAYEG